MISLLILIPVAALLILDYFIADEFRCIAQRKGYCGRKYFWWSFFTGPVGHLMVIALPDRFCCGPMRTEEEKAAPIEKERYSNCYC